MSDKQFDNGFGGVDEQAVNDHLEGLVGIDRSFRLMNLARETTQAVSGNQFTLGKKKDPKAVFRKKAKDDRFNDEAIEFYLKHFCSWG